MSDHPSGPKGVPAAGGSDPRRVAATDDELRASLRAALSSRLGAPATITGMRRAPLDKATSYPAEVVHVHLGTGGELKLLVKDLSASRLPKDRLDQRREREFRVYRDLLQRAEVGTARYYGTVGDESQDRLCLLLEFVDGVRLRSSVSDHRVVAARWLGRFQGAFAGQADLVERCDFLVRHDAGFFRSKAELAQQAVAQRSASLVPALARSLRNYERVVEVMARQPRTLVHGSFRAQNILIDPRATPPRVCPVDWELAACGAPLYDLTFLSHRLGSPKLDGLWNAYREEAEACAVSVPPRDELRHVVDCFRLHKILKALSESVIWKFRERSVVKLVAMAEEVSSALG